MVKCKIEITQKELDALIEIWLLSEKNIRKRKLGRIAFAIIAILTALLAVRGYFHYKVGTAVMFGAFCAFSVFMATVGATLEQKLILKKAQNKADDRMKSGVREYGFSESGVTIDSELVHSESDWNAFKLWGTYKDYIYLRRIDDGMILINKNSMTGDEFNELAALLNANVKIK